MNKFLFTAERLVREAGSQASQIAVDSRHVLADNGYGDIVTKGDLKVEDYVVKRLMEQFPNHGFDSEEMGREKSDAEYVWILDPIDGTKYYAKGIPLYSVSLALAHRGKLVLGVVYSPESDQMYSASIGRPATLNGKRIRCSAEDRFEKASICLEIPSRDSPRDELQWALGNMSLLTKLAYRVRIIGVGSLGLCFCASGGFDAYVNLGSVYELHDVAAGQVILREAGGEFSYLGKQGRQIIAGPAALCNKIRAALKI